MRDVGLKRGRLYELMHGGHGLLPRWFGAAVG
jgi:hypothetical protein